MDQVLWDSSAALFSSVFHRKQKVVELREVTKELEEKLIMNGKSLLAVPRQSQSHYQKLQ